MTRERPSKQREKTTVELFTTNVVRLGAMAVVALVSGVSIALHRGWELGIVGGWAAGCLVYIIMVWGAIWRFDGERTRRYAQREEPARAITDGLVILASLASLAATLLLLIRNAQEGTTDKAFTAGTALCGVVLSWLLIHTLYALRYAREYYHEPVGGIDFNGESTPRYSDFAYVSFDLGMTFQISDTNISTNRLRRMVLGHTLLSYLFNTVIVATMVNLIVGFASGS